MQVVIKALIDVHALLLSNNHLKRGLQVCMAVVCVSWMIQANPLAEWGGHNVENPWYKLLFFTGTIKK